jgi:hypothetical protein
MGSQMTNLMRSALAVVSRTTALCMPLFIWFAPGPVLAEDSGCKAVVAAQRQQLTVPVHGHTTVTLTPGKPEPSEEIYTDKAIYVLQAGKWTVSPISLADMAQQLEDNIKSGKMSCRLVRDETVDGVSATLYSVHQELDGLASDSQFWISKATGLPVMLKTTAIESHFTYTNVVAPAVR